MKQTLGILVRSDRYMKYVVNLTAAAHAKGKEVHILFTGSGVRLTLGNAFPKLVGIADLAICDASFRSHGFNGREKDIPGIAPQHFVTQDHSARMIRHLDRTVVL